MQWTLVHVETSVFFYTTVSVFTSYAYIYLITIHAHQLSTTNHRLRGSGSTVVTMTSKVNGKTEILTPCRSKTAENIEAKFVVIDYVVDPYKLANFCGNPSKGVCSPYW